MRSKKFLFITGELIKHKYLAIKLMHHYSTSRIIIESYPKEISKNYSPDKNKIISNHFYNVDKTDKKFFGKYVSKNKSFLKSRTLSVCKKNKINSLKIYNLIDKFNPDLIILCATSIIKSRILNRFQNKIINFHAGLTQYYRGAGCNVWAIYYKEFEKIGITIHYVNRDLDDGGIIIQSRPKINFKDNSHTIGIKSYNLGYSLILKCLRFYNTNNFLPSIYKKNLKSIKICKKKDFKKEIILEINKLIATNQLKVNNKKQKLIKIINSLK